MSRISHPQNRDKKDTSLSDADLNLNWQVKRGHYINGEVLFKVYLINGQRYYYEQFCPDGKLQHRMHYQDNLFHRLDNPAHESFYSNGMLCFRKYYLNNKLHRLNGPAIEHFDISGKRTTAEYWLNDKKLTKTEHQRQTALLKLAAQSISKGDMLL